MKFALSVVAAALTFNTSVSANTADDPERITIEGQYLSINESNSVKTPTPIIDVPQSLSIMTAEEITERGITSIGCVSDNDYLLKGRGKPEDVFFEEGKTLHIITKKSLAT